MTLFVKPSDWRGPRGSFGLDTTGRGRFPVATKEDRTINGHRFDSKKEAVRYAELKLLERAGLIECLEFQPSWNVSINGKHFTRYTCDFAYLDKKRGPVLEEVKSSGTAKDAAYLLRKKAAELAFGLKITEVIR